MRLESPELLMWKAATLYHAGKPCGVEATAAKYLAAEASDELSLRAAARTAGSASQGVPSLDTHPGGS
jgi:acyl-CoA dehydrogenase